MSQRSRRLQRFEKEVRQLTSEFLICGIKDPIDGMVTVSRVYVGSDLRSAKVYVRFTGVDSPDEAMATLKSNAYVLQKFIHSKLHSKFCPKVEFILDETFEKVMRVEQLLHENAEAQ